MAFVQTGNHTVLGPRGLPILKPPYSELVAVDMNRGEHCGAFRSGARRRPCATIRSEALNLDFDRMGNLTCARVRS